MQTLAKTRNIVGANYVISCCAMLAYVCKRSQQVTTCWVFRWEYKRLWDTNTHNSIHTTLWYACAGATLLEVLCKRTQHCWTMLRWPWNNRNFGTCWLWSLTSFKLHPTTSNKSQQHTTWFANVRDMLDSTMLRPFGQQCSERLHGPLNCFSSQKFSG